MEAYLVIDKKATKDVNKAVGFQMPGNPKFIWLELSDANKFWKSNPEIQANFNIVKVIFQIEE